MGSLRPAGPYPLGSARTTTWLVRFDASGACASPATQSALLASLTKDHRVIIFSHGWQTDFGAAVSLYSSFLARFEAAMDKAKRSLDKVVFVGVTWPSKWLPAHDGPKMAADGASGPEEWLNQIADVKEALATYLGPANAAKFYELTDHETLDRQQAMELAAILLPLHATFEEDESGGSEELDAASVVTIWEDLQRLDGGGSSGSPGFVSGANAPALDGPAIAGQIRLDPLDAVRLFSIYQMKDRAGRVGSSGVSRLLHGLVEKAGWVHAVGHSFGAKVMLSAINALPQNLSLRSLLLLQPAVSRLCFSSRLPKVDRPGGYAGVPAKLDSPLLSTFSELDQPLHAIYQIAMRRPSDLGDIRVAGPDISAYAALGGYGPPPEDGQSISLPAFGAPFSLPQGAKIVGLNGSDNLIKNHGDVTNDHTAWALTNQF